MGKKSKVPEYSSATVDSKLFGSATADKKGVTFNPAAWQTDLSNAVTSSLTPTVNQMNSTLGNILSGDYLNDANFQTYKSNFDRQAKNTFDTAVLGNLADRNLMRSSGIQALNNSYTNAMNNDLTNLMDNYYNRQVNNYNLLGSNLGNLLNTQNSLYSYLTGLGTMAQNQANAVSGYNAQKAQIENANNGSLFNTLMNAGATLGGLALGGAPGSVAGTALSKLLTKGS